MSNFSTFFPAGGGGEGAGINSYAPFKKSATGNPIGYNSTTGLYTNPVDDSVWLETGNLLNDTTTPRTYPNATSFGDMFIQNSPAPVRLKGSSPYNTNQGLLYRYVNSTDYIYNANSGTLGQFSYNSTAKTYTQQLTVGTHSGLSYGAWDRFAVHENSGRWYDKGTPLGSLAIMPSDGNGNPNISSITYYNMTPEVGSGYYAQPQMIIGNLLYVTNQSLSNLWEYSLDATTGAVTGYTGNTWNLVTLLGNGNIRDLKYDPISQFVYSQGISGNPEMIQLNPTTFAATGVAYDTVANTADTTPSLTSVARFAFGKIGATNVLFIQGTIYQQSVGQFYSQASDFTSKVGDSTIRTDASGSGQRLFIKLK